MSIPLVDACISQRANQPAGCAANDGTGGGTHSRGEQPTACNHWPDAGDCKHAQSGEQPASATDRCANASAGACTLRDVIGISCI
jgi:hypothetical protein